MNLKTSFTRLAFVLSFSLLASPVAAGAQQTFANWTDPTTFDFGAITATAATSNPMNAGGMMLESVVDPDGRTNYPDVWYTPTPPMGSLWSSGSINNAAAGSNGSVDVTVTFSAPVTNPRFHFINLDNASVDFTGETVTFLSGNPIFDVVGSVINATTQQAMSAGCQDAAGGGPNGACGTVEIAGTFTSLTFTATDLNPSTAAGDGFQWTVSIDPAVGAVEAIPTLSEWMLILLAALLATAAALVLRRRRAGEGDWRAA